MRILALEPYYGGSHRTFLDGWISQSRHDWTVLTLPAFKWKWRMRHGAWSLARQGAELAARGSRWEGIFCSSMLDLATFLGLVPADISRLPAVVYFHENQLTYPVRTEAERDLHFAFTHLSSGLAARAVWFNSEFHRREFLGALANILSRMPDFSTPEAVDEIRGKSSVEPPGVLGVPARPARSPGPLRILWAARWEFDKNPEGLFAALEILEARQVPYRLSVLGESYREVPEIFPLARQRFAHRIDRWGYQDSRDDYLEALLQADVFVSTAIHEFFGIAAAEALAAGCYPLLPDRLAYPELLASLPEASRSQHLYPGGPEELAARLEVLAADPDPCRRRGISVGLKAVRRLLGADRYRLMDDSLAASVQGRQ